MRNRPIYNIVALLARCGVGLVFVAHGWQKIQVGINATGQNLDAMGAPAPTAAAVCSMFIELLGGVALILGLVLPVAGTLLFLDMVGAVIFVHAKHGIFLVNDGKVHNGFELVLILGLAALVFAAGGGGRITLDHRLFGHRGTRSDDGDRTEPVPAVIAPPEPLADSDTAPRRRSTPRLSRKRAESSTTGEHPVPPAGRFPAPPETKETAARPRLAADMVTDTSRDVIVAGKKEPESSSEDTTPVRTRKKSPKSGS